MSRHYLILSALLIVLGLMTVAGCPKGKPGDVGGKAAAPVADVNAGNTPAASESAPGEKEQPASGTESGQASTAGSDNASGTGAGSETTPSGGENNGTGDNAGAAPAESTGTGEAPAGQKTPLPPTGKLWSAAEIGKNQNEIVKALFETGKGNFTLELYPEIAPNSVAAFVKYIKLGYYDGTYFHRVVKEDKLSVAQAGQPLTRAELDKLGWDAARWPPDAKDKSKLADSVGKILDEPNYAMNETATVALAKMPSVVGGYEKDSARVEFFINLAYNSHLDRDFTVFGKVVDGMTVVNSISQDDKIVKVTIVP